MADAKGVERRRAPLPGAGGVLAPIYSAIVSWRNAKYDAGRGVVRFAGAMGKPIPVVSIGNLSVGGTGKTPMVMHVLRLLMERGHRPCVAMRGYTKSKGEAPDETDAYRRAFPDLPIVAQADRTAGLRKLLGQTGTGARPDCIVLDDGFQHRRIARDLDVVLIDATANRSVFEDRLLPAGWLREPVESLKRAGAVVLTHAELAGAERVAMVRQEIARRTSALVAVTRHVWTGLKQRVGDDDRMLPLDVLIGKRVFGCCAIGHPDAFAASLNKIARGGDGTADSARVGQLLLPDHDPYGPARIQTMVEMARSLNAEYIVVTDKDWSKLRRLPDSTWPCPVVRPELALVFDSGREEFDRMVLGAVGT